jgi:hypothetical protein
MNSDELRNILRFAVHSDESSFLDQSGLVLFSAKWWCPIRQ